MDITEHPILIFQQILKESEKAYQIKFSATDIHWLPKSQIRVVGDHIYIPQWLINEKGLSEYDITQEK